MTRTGRDVNRGRGRTRRKKRRRKRRRKGSVVVDLDPASLGACQGLSPPPASALPSSPPSPSPSSLSDGMRPSLLGRQGLDVKGGREELMTTALLSSSVPSSLLPSLPFFLLTLSCQFLFPYRFLLR